MVQVRMARRNLPVNRTRRFTLVANAFDGAEPTKYGVWISWPINSPTARVFVP